jgi:mannose-1-phosphate guanylyltransferase
MLQATVKRVADRRLFNAPVLLLGEAHVEETTRQLAEISLPAGKVIAEPAIRNTAPAIALAASLADPDELLLVMPSDHVVGRPDRLIEAVQAAVPAAQEGWLVTFGIAPDRPETGYGYIRRGPEIGAGLFRVERFIEKPDAQSAAAYLKAGGYDWNAGIFLFRAAAYLEALEKHAPDIFTSIRDAIAGVEVRGSSIMPAAAPFCMSPSISIDHAVLEKAENVVVRPVDMAWSDVGSWEAVYQLKSKDLDGNVIHGDAAPIDAQRCLLWSDGPAITAVGVEDLAIIAVEGAILVVPLKESQRVREAARRIASRGPAPSKTLGRSQPG